MQVHSLYLVEITFIITYFHKSFKIGWSNLRCSVCTLDGRPYNTSHRSKLFLLTPLHINNFSILGLCIIGVTRKQIGNINNINILKLKCILFKLYFNIGFFFSIDECCLYTYISVKYQKLHNYTI